MGLYLFLVCFKMQQVIFVIVLPTEMLLGFGQPFHFFPSFLLWSGQCWYVAFSSPDW